MIDRNDIQSFCKFVRLFIHIGGGLLYFVERQVTGEYDVSSPVLNDWGNTVMLNVKLNYLRLLNEEINRLEALREQMAKSRDDEKRKEYYDDLAWCRREKGRLLCEGLLDKLPLSSEERVMAHLYYYKGKTWKDAFKDLRDTLPYEKRKLYGEEEEKKEEDKEEEEKPNKNMVRLKKSITRKIQNTFNYYIKAKEN